MFGLSAVITAMAMLAGGLAFAADAPARRWSILRTADGHPDFGGVWTNATITPLERPNEFGQRRVLTDAEAAQLERRQASAVERGAAPSDLTRELPPAGDGVGGYNNFWIDRGSKVAVVNGEKRSSLIVDPPNGHVPPLKPERRARAAGAVQRMRNFDGPESRPLGERCLLAFGSSSGPPMLPVLYNNHYQIVQTKDTITILVEMVHDARVIRLNSEHVPTAIRKWMGDSIGRFEGESLIVETTNFTSKEGFRGATEDRKVTERFTRVGPETINYRVTIEDPASLTQPWSAEYPFYLTDERIYEYACHEGNYALPGILAGARQEEQSAKR
jgi:hypothetical protein